MFGLGVLSQSRKDHAVPAPFLFRQSENNLPALGWLQADNCAVVGDKLSRYPLFFAYNHEMVNFFILPAIYQGFGVKYFKDPLAINKLDCD